MKMRAWCTGCLLVLVIAATTSSQANAQDEPHTSVDNRARAQQLFDSAFADAVAGNFAAACPKFLASQEADPKTSTLLNLANCYEKNGQTASAWGAFREAETRARKASRPDWETQARTRADALEPKLLRISIVVNEADKVPGLVVSRDGAHLGSGEWGVSIPVDPGEHVISASAEGFKSWDTRVPVKDDSALVTVQVPKLEALPPPPPIAPPPIEAPPPARGWSTWKTTGAITAGVGAVGLITSGIIGIIAKGNYNDARARCLDGARACPASAVDDSTSAYHLAAGGTIAFVAGAVLLAGGAALFIVNYDDNAASSRQVAIGVGQIHGTW